MGLDAVVYKNRASVDVGKHSSEALVVPETGEIYFDQPQHYPDYPKEYFEAVSFRIGNISAVADLRDELRKTLGTNSSIERMILYSGSHSGDVVPPTKFAELEREIDALSQIEPKSSHLVEFLNQLSLLINAGRSNGNPIVFV